MASLQGTRPEACLEKHLVKRPLDKYHLDTRTRTFFSTFAKLDIRKKLLFVNVKTVLVFAIMNAHVASVSLFGQKIVQTISHFLVIEKKIVPSETQHFFSSTLTAFMMVQAKLNIPSTLNIDLILWHTQLIVCAENFKSWFKSWVFPFTFQAYILLHTLNCMCDSLFKFHI